MSFRIAALLFVLLAASAKAEGRYFCEVKDVLEVDSSGRLKGSALQPAAGTYDFYFDTETGAYTDQSINWTFIVKDPGGTENGVKAIRTVSGPAQLVVQYLSIATYDENQFLLAWDREVRSGQCARQNDGRG